MFTELDGIRQWINTAGYGAGTANPWVKSSECLPHSHPGFDGVAYHWVQKNIDIMRLQIQLNVIDWTS